jgi:membrane protease YdiL (CAAX protease family)
MLNDPENGREPAPDELEQGEPDSGSPPGSHLVQPGLLFYGAMAAVAVIWRIGFYAEPILFSTPEAEAAGVQPVQNLALGIGVGLAIVALSYFATRATRWGEDLARGLADQIGSLSVPDAVLLAFASGLAEEMLFRGALQPRVGWLAASLLFGLAHLVPRRVMLPWTAFAVAAGALFGWLFEATGNLIAPVAAHTVVNAINLPMLVRLYGAEDPEASSR